MEKQRHLETFAGKTGFISAFLVCVFAMALTGPVEAAQGAAKYTDKGELMMPRDFRQWVFIGAPVTPNDKNNGKFPNGTVIVKELAGVGAKSSASGSGYFAGEFIGVAASVKDAKRFAKEPGNWGYFSFMGDGGKALASAACNACHQQNAAEDLVFTQHYPVLRAAKPAK